MKHLIFPLLLLTGVLGAQEPKGVQPAPPTAPGPSQAVTRAVVVGISDYQSQAIQDLRFADRDALAFADYLRSPAGGGLPLENIQVLTNGNATQGKMVAALDWLTAETQKGDRAIIYFSGHGDVEIKSAAQLGFLLCADAPPASYKAGGAYPLFFLQDNVATISGNGGKVLLILDACHAGKLAGATINGTASTATALTRPFADEVKILSCQPNELSLEGEQWGGGRGVFSFNLVEGLEGLADRNGDGSVNLLEIGHYLEDVVPAETAPVSQIPMTTGERNSPLARVDAPTLAALKKEKENRAAALAKLDGKGMTEALLPPGDTLSRQLYQRFQQALDSGWLLEPVDRSAWETLRVFPESPEHRPLRNLMRRNLAAALQDEVQQALNALLSADPEEVEQWRNAPEKYALYPVYLERTIGLLGQQHYLYPSLMAKKLYFEAYNLSHPVRVQNFELPDSIRQLAKAKLLLAAAYDPEAAYIYHAIGYLYYLNNPYQTDSMVAYCNRALALAPNWALPYADMSGEWLWCAGNIEASDLALRKLLSITPDSYVALERYATTCLWLNRVDEAKTVCRRMIRMHPELGNGYTVAIWAALQKQEFDSVTVLARKLIQIYERPITTGLAAVSNEGYVGLCRALDRTRHYREGLALLDSAALHIMQPSNLGCFEEKASVCFDLRDYACVLEMVDSMTTRLGSNIYGAYSNCWAGKAAFQLGDLAAAERYLAAGMEADPTPNDHDCWLFTYMGLIKEKQGKLAEAREWFEKSEAYPYWLSTFPIKIDTKLLYGQFLLRQKEPEKALEKFTFIVHNCPNDYRGWYGLALYHAYRNENTAALDNLEKALLRYYPVPGPVNEEPLFQHIRKTKRFKAMMAKAFRDVELPLPK